jgi:hypothetical protein
LAPGDGVDLLSQDATHWRGTYWRSQIAAAFGIVLLLGFGLSFVERDLSFILIAGAAVALPAWWVIQSWLALSEVDRSSGANFWRSAAVAALLYLGGFAAGVFSYGRGKLDWGVLPFVAPLLVAVLARAIYAWRDARERPVGLFRTQFARISHGGAQLHLAGYVVALAAAIAAAAPFQGWTLRSAAYVTGALIGKLAIDLLFARPAPLKAPTVAAALARMTVLSPLWWGLPWGLLAAAYLAVTDIEATASLARLNMSIVFHTAVAVVLLFAALTAVAYVQDFGKAKPSEDTAESDLSPPDWTRLYAGVMFLAVAAYAVIYVPFWRSDEELFGVEKWTCARTDDGWMLGWIGRPGVRIKVQGYIDLFNISCVPEANGKGCAYDEEGWDAIEFVVHGADGFDTKVAFNRKSEGVKASYRHHAYVYGALGNELLWALYGGKSAEMTIKAPRGRVLYAKRMDLTGYGRALKACAAKWEQEAAGR